MSESRKTVVVPLSETTQRELEEGIYQHFFMRNVPIMTRVVIKPGSRTKPHQHTFEEQTYYIIKGVGKLHVDEHTYELKEQTAVLISPGSVHSIENTGEGDLEWVMQYLWPGEVAQPKYNE